MRLSVLSSLLCVVSTGCVDSGGGSKWATDTAAETPVDSAPETNPDTGTETDSEADTGVETDTGTEPDSGTENDTGTETDTGTEPDSDSDGDGIPDAVDACPGHDDTIDSDDDGIPDGCDGPPFPTHDCMEDRYTAELVHGWEICIEASLFVAAGLGEDVMTLLEDDLTMIVSLVEPDVATWLRTVRIWIEEDGDWPAAVYHPSAAWLAGEGYPTHWAESVQITNAANYLSWTSVQPAMVLHELSHAWHHQYVGYEHPGIQAAFDDAMAAGLYDSVPYAGGGTDEAYATTNHIEYFAELTEAWFWENDYYPFNRAELLEFDPVGAAVVESVWTMD